MLRMALLVAVICATVQPARAHDILSSRSKFEQDGRFEIVQAQATSAASSSCITLDALFKDRLPQLGGKSWMAFQLKRDGQAWHLVFTQKTNDRSATAAKWLVASRHSQERPDLYCIQSTGALVEVLMTLHDSIFSERYGMPGSNNPRCSNSDDPLGGVKVRAWASRELGDSLILSLNGAASGVPTFALLMSKTGQYWILLERKVQAGTCYFDRGELSDMKDLQLN